MSRWSLNLRDRSRQPTDRFWLFILDRLHSAVSQLATILGELRTHQDELLRPVIDETDEFDEELAEELKLGVSHLLDINTILRTMEARNENPPAVGFFFHDHY